MTTKPKLIAGNWKMNGLLSEGRTLAGELRGRLEASGPLPIDLVLFPPFTMVHTIAAVLQGSSIAVGGQDCHSKTNGAHTGDVSAIMLADAGARYVLVGHSERRQDHGETDSLVSEKAAAAHSAGLIAIICVGETQEQRDAGTTDTIIAAQVRNCSPVGINSANTVFAYEPVWAIGSGRVPTPANVADIHGLIREVLSGLVNDASAMRILYGGSVKPQNAANFLTLPEVDGALVGGASLDAQDFWKIADCSKASPD